MVARDVLGGLRVGEEVDRVFFCVDERHQAELLMADARDESLLEHLPQVGLASVALAALSLACLEPDLRHIWVAPLGIPRVQVVARDSREVDALKICVRADPTFYEIDYDDSLVVADVAAQVDLSRVLHPLR